MALSFELEMSGIDQMIRFLTRDKSLTRKEVFQSEIENFSIPNSYLVEEQVTTKEFTEIVASFIEDNPNKNIVITLDHILLIKGTGGDKAIIDEFYVNLVNIKRHFEAQGRNVLYLILSQLNRDILAKDRISNPMFHYPMQSDLMSSSGIYQCSDYVIVAHVPANIKGVGEFYGPPHKGFPKGLPTKIDKHKCVFLHIIKNRFGDPSKMCWMTENFKYSKIDEYKFREE